MSRIGESIETEHGQVVARGWGKVGIGSEPERVQAFFGADEESSGKSGDGCTALGIH